MPEIRRVAVLGCGLMGSGIAEIAAKAGYETWVRELNDDLVARGRAGITKSLDRAVDKGKLDAAVRDEALGRLKFTTSLDELNEVDIVIEAVTEDIDLKNELFRTLDGVCPEHTIFASNTSSLTIAALAAATNRPHRFVGLHFFNPVPVMTLVEVVRTIAVDQQVFLTAYDFAKTLGKEPVEAKDTSGFIVNRLLVPYMLDAIRCLEQGLASTEDIDKSMTLGTGYPMGPFTLCDFVGIDTLYYIAEIMFDEFRDARYAPPPLLRRMVSFGYFGRKTKRGFYDYSGDRPRVVDLGI
ncbi:MAG: 3-hydroxyacyl-CoA dehydrogenase family protein [Longimicrobiales bacterium]